MTCRTVFNEILEKCLQKEDQVWANSFLSRSSLYHKLTDLQIRQVIRDSIKCAEDQWVKWCSLAGVFDVEEFLVSESVRIEESNEPLMDDYLHFAEYTQNPPRIRLKNQAIEQTEKVIQDGRLGLLLEEVDLRRLVLAHELFHHFEACDPDLYTHHAYARTQSFGRFQRKVHVRAASEIAAVHFSKLVTGVSYCPAIMEILLVHSVDEQRARLLAEKIMTEKWG